MLRELIYPRKCVLCHRLLKAEEPRLCPSCVAALPEPFSGARRGSYYTRWASALWYTGMVRSSFTRYKFGGCRFYVRYFGPLLANAIFYIIYQTTAFFYLGVILLLCIPFVWPRKSA